MYRYLSGIHIECIHTHMHTLARKVVCVYMWKDRKTDTHDLQWKYSLLTCSNPKYFGLIVFCLSQQINFLQKELKYR